MMAGSITCTQVVSTGFYQQARWYLGKNGVKVQLTTKYYDRYRTGKTDVFKNPTPCTANHQVLFYPCVIESVLLRNSDTLVRAVLIERSAGGCKSAGECSPGRVRLANSLRFLSRTGRVGRPGGAFRLHGFHHSWCGDFLLFL
jgi:hypothetical protein